jgi:hypothetical protein
LLESSFNPCKTHENIKHSGWPFSYRGLFILMRSGVSLVRAAVPGWVVNKAASCS